jgi:SAM-dependent methyltransferase
MHSGVDRNTIKNLDVLKKFRRKDASLFKFFDEKYNIDTWHPILLCPDGSGEYMPGSIDNHDRFPGSMGFQNSPLGVLDIINNFMKDIEGIEEYTFLDVGSGKGKTILHQLISDAPYKKYVGVEIDDKLNDVALNNLKTINIEINKEVNFINTDINNYDFSEEKCVYYFYYPLSADDFNKLILNKWEVLSKSKSFFVFHFQNDYIFKDLIKKDPIYDYAEIYIYQI